MSSLFLISFFGLGTFVLPSISESLQYDILNSRDLFEDYLWNSHKEYENELEYEKRLKNFEDNLKFINKLNRESDTAEYGINHLSDLTFEEIQERYMGFNSNLTINDAVDYEYVATGAAPESLDWRESGIVAPVKNQGQCGSCYSFAAIGAIEGQNAFKHGHLVSLSVQQGLDCVEISAGCAGGLPNYVISSLIKQGGSMAEKDYPYTKKQGQCHTDKEKIVARVTEGLKLKVKNEEELRDALATHGPLAIALDFSHTLYFYKKGISLPQDCKTEPLTHAVLLVGYGVEAGTPYWIIKNSYGAGYGEQGYLRLVRGQKACGIGTYVVAVVVE